MKNWIKMLAMFIVVLFLGGCSGGETKQKVFVGSKDGIDSVVTYKYKNDKILQQITQNTVSYNLLGVKTKEEAKTLIDNATKDQKKVTGYESKIEYKDKEVVEEITLDFEKGNIQELVKEAGLTAEGDLSKGISMKKTEELMLKNGFTIKE